MPMKSNTPNRVIQCDTRQVKGKHDLKHRYFEEHGYKLIRSKLYVGDYLMVGGTIAVDTKASLSEVHMNLTKDHARFRRECVNAIEAGYQLHVLVENEHGITCGRDLALWEEPPWAMAKRKRAKEPIDGARLLKTMVTMYKKYGVMWWFCSPQDAGAKVIEILEGGSPHGDG